MLITQKYNSTSDIDIEFIPSLEELLSESIPSFELIRAHEREAAPNKNFIYYLFFGNKTNAPIGFAQIEMTKDKECKENVFEKFLKRKEIKENKNEKSVKWAIPGAHKEGIIFDPKYSKYASKMAQEIYSDYLEREDVYSQVATFSDAYDLTNKEQDSSTINSNQDIFFSNIIKALCYLKESFVVHLIF